MDKIMLKVTNNALKHATQEGKWNQAQIAIVNPPFQADGANRKKIAIGGVIKLAVGDTHAIWHSHNTVSKTQRTDFERLFALLANHPDEEVEFFYCLL